MKIAEKSYYSEQFAKCSNSNSETWTFINNILNKNGSKGAELKTTNLQDDNKMTIMKNFDC